MGLNGYGYGSDPSPCVDLARERPVRESARRACVHVMTEGACAHT